MIIENRPLAELGLQEIHVACLNGRHEVVQKLLGINNAINSRTSIGETPLILATLMGHIEAVVILREHNAPIEATDKFRRSAISYTSENAFTDARRKVYIRHGFKAKENGRLLRTAIAALLSPTPLPRSLNSGIPLGPIFFRKTSNGVEVYQSIGNIETPGLDPRTKTVGVIRVINNSTPRAWALSGWSRYTSNTCLQLLDGYTWTKAVLHRVAPAIGFKFQFHIKDQGWKPGQLPTQYRGRFFASHTECKLAVWYCFSILTAIKSAPNASKTFLAKHLGDLAQTDLGEAKYAKIDIDQPPCESCARFLIALTKVTGVEFECIYRRTLSLVPEVKKRRNFLLAHEADMTEPADEDDGSTSGEDLESSDEDAVYEGWFSDTEDENILGGSEEFEIEAFNPAILSSTKTAPGSQSVLKDTIPTPLEIPPESIPTPTTSESPPVPKKPTSLTYQSDCRDPGRLLFSPQYYNKIQEANLRNSTVKNRKEHLQIRRTGNPLGFQNRTQTKTIPPKDQLLEETGDQVNTAQLTNSISIIKPWQRLPSIECTDTED